MRILILGCGYVGSALGALLSRQGHSVTGVVRSKESASALASLGLAEIRVADCSTSQGALAACRGGADAVLLSLSSRGGNYRRTYFDSMGYVLEALRRCPPRFFFYTSSTSVYAQTDGSWVTETSPTEPPDGNGRCLLETEDLLRAACRAGFPGCILRLAGIYGPGRHFLLNQLRDGIGVLPGDGGRWMNHIHRDDAADAIRFLLEHPGQASGGRIFNLTDNEPILQRDYVAWICGKLERKMPRFDPDAEPLGERARKSHLPNRRISNLSLRNLGWAPPHPSFHEGLTPLLTKRPSTAT